MEQRLLSLKSQMELQKELRDDTMKSTGSRWKAASTKQIRNYANKVIEGKRQPNQKDKLKLTMPKLNSTQKIPQPQMRPSSKKNETSISFTKQTSIPSIKQAPLMKSSRPSSSRSSLNNSRLSQSANPEKEKENIQNNNNQQNILWPLGLESGNETTACTNLQKHINQQKQS